MWFILILKQFITFDKLEYSKYLESGVYSFSLSKLDTKLILYNRLFEKEINQNFKLKPKNLKEYVKLYYVKMLAPFFKVHINSSENKLCINMIIFTRTEKNKLVDIHNEYIYTEISKKDFKLHKKTLNYFSKFYNTTFIMFMQHESLLKEKLIGGIPFNQLNLAQKSELEKSLKDSILKKLEYDYSKSFYKKYSLKDSMKLSNLSHKNILQLITQDKYDYIFEMYKEVELYYVLSHGDLHFNNILFDGQNYLIDFDDTSFYVFYYDFFDPYFMEALSNNDYDFFKKLKYNLNDIKYLSSYFSAFDLKFQLNDVGNYFTIYYLNKIRNLDKVDQKSFDSISKIYKDVFEAILKYL